MPRHYRNREVSDRKVGKGKNFPLQFRPKFLKIRQLPLNLQFGHPVALVLKSGRNFSIIVENYLKVAKPRELYLPITISENTFAYECPRV